MKAYRMCAYLFLTLTCNLCQGAIELEGKRVEKSKYYTGNSGSAEIHYVSLEDWLEFRSKDDLPKDIYNRGFILDSPEMLEPLYKIANKLLEQWPGTAPEFPIFIRTDTAASVYGAETLITNELLMYYGSLVNAESDDEIAAILAHEIAHILLGHNSKANYVRVALQLLDDYEGMKNLYSTVKAGDIVEVGEKTYKLEFDSSLEKNILKAREQRERAAEFYYAYHGSVLGRPAEIQADLLAADLLIQAGYSPLGLRDTLDNLSSSYLVEKFVSELLEQTSGELLEVTEQTMNEQITAFQDKLKTASSTGQLSMDTVKPSLSFSTFAAGMKEELTGSVKDFAWKRIKTSHPVPEKRITKLVNYLDENYGVMQRLKPKSQHLLREYKDKNLSSITSYNKLQKTSTAMMEGNFDQAATLGMSSLLGADDDDPFKRYTAHRIRLSQNNVGSAIANIKRIGNYHAVPTNQLVEMADLLVKNDKISLADKLVHAKEHFGYQVPELYATKIDIALARKDADSAKKLARACVDTKNIDQRIKTRCTSYGLLAEEKSAGKTGGFFGGLKAATSSMGNALNDAVK